MESRHPWQFPVWSVLGVILAVMLLVGALPAAAANNKVEITSVAAAQGTFLPGDTVPVTVKWTNSGSDAAAVVRCKHNKDKKAAALTRNIVLTKGSSTAVVDFNINWSTAPGEYSVTVINTVTKATYNGGQNTFTVAEAVEANITSPTTAAPATKSPGDTLAAAYEYKANYNTPVFIRLAEQKSSGPVVDSDRVTLARSGTTGRTTIAVPSNAPLGNYTLTMVPARGDTRVLNEKTLPEINAVILQPRLAITSPTRNSPASVQPGGRITVQYNYELSDTAAAEIRLLTAGGGEAASTGATLNHRQKSGSVTLAIPEKTTPGKYDLEIKLKDKTDAYSHTQQGAVAVEHRTTADISAPTRSKTVSVTAGGKVTVDFKYTASAKTRVQVKIRDRGPDPLVESSVTLEQTSRAKVRSVSLTIPKDTAAGRYDVVVESPVSGRVLDTTRDAVRVDAKVSARITSPTRAKPKTVRAGRGISVDFDYTADNDAELVVKIADADDKVLTSRTTGVSVVSKKENKTVRLNIPSRAVAGEYKVQIYGKYGDKPLSEQEQAVTVQDTLGLTIESPTTDKPARLSSAGTFNVRLRHTADVDTDIRLEARKPDGAVRTAKTVTLPKTSGGRSETVPLTLPPGTPSGGYDLVIINSKTGRESVRQSQAVQLTSYPEDVEVRLEIGKSGRWVNGRHQPVDMAPRIIENRTLLPIRHVGEPLGWHFNWDNGKKEATVTRDGKRVRVRVNSSNAAVSTDHEMTWRTARIDPGNSSVQPVLTSGRVLLPLRFVGETLGTKVAWDKNTQTVTVVQGKPEGSAEETEPEQAGV